MKARDNPFRTERVLEVRYRLQGGSWPELMAKLASLNFRAAIVGPEGTGKTTLLEDLAPRLASAGFEAKPLRLNQESPKFPFGFARRFLSGLGRGDVVLLDGADRMGGLAWSRFRARSRKAGGLVVTSHRAGLLPTLIECSVSPALLRGIVSELLGDDAAGLSGQMQELFERHRGNLRDCLRALYDLYAAR